MPHPAPDLTAIRARVNCVTPGRWLALGQSDLARGDDAAHTLVILPDQRTDLVVCDCDQSGIVEVRENAAFIAHAPTDVRALLAHVDALQDRIAALEAALRSLVDNAPIYYDSIARDYKCAMCDTMAIRADLLVHEDNCAYVAARVVLGGDA